MLYTDILSGPITGGESNKGIYLSVFGKNFDCTNGTMTVKVGSASTSTFKLCQMSKARQDIQQITIQLGNLTGASLVNGTSYPVTVNVGGQDALNPYGLTFTPLAGNIYFVATNGSDSNAGTYAAPFASIQKSGGVSLTFQITTASTGGAYGVVRAGDFIVMRGGTYALTANSFNGYFMQALNKSGCPIGTNCAQGGGTTSGPITVMGYPGETAHINASYTSGDNSGGAFSAADSAREGNGYGAYWTFTNLTVESGLYDGPFNTQRGDLNTALGSHWRVVNNEMTAVTCQSATACRAGGVAGDGNGNYWVGNYVHDIYDGNPASSALENHGFYIGNAGSYEIAFNRIVNIYGGNGIQTNNNGAAAITNVSIHHNIINGTGKHGLNIADATTGLLIYDNIIMNTDVCGLRLNSDTLSGGKIYNNTFYNTDRLNAYSAAHAAIQNDGTLSSNSLEFRNNIVVPGNSNRYYEGGNIDFNAVASTMSNNLWYNGGDTYMGSSNQTSNPSFVNTTSGSEDFHLQAGSAARNTGTATNVSATVSNDYDVTTARPQESVYDIGAYEYKP